MSVTLIDFLTQLSTTNVQVVIKDMELNNICKIYASASNSLSDALKERTVHSWDIIRSSLLNVYLNNDGQETIINVTGVELDQETVNLKVGDSLTLNATIMPVDATNKNVMWLSTDESIITVDNGLIMAISEGNANVVVTTEDGSFTAMCSVEVSAQEEIISVTGITLSSDLIQLNIGETITLTPIIEPINATNKNVVWSSNSEEIATVENGTISAISEGSAVITATTEDGGFSANCEITVSIPIIQIENIILNETELNLTVDSEPVQLIATVLPEDATDKSVIWASSNEQVVTVDTDGIVSVVGVGSADITASGGEVISQPCVVIVNEQQIIQVESISLNETTLNLEVGGEQVTLIATVLPDDATDKTVTWASSNEDVVTIDNGVITIIGEGTASITASAGDVISEPCEVTVIQP